MSRNWWFLSMMGAVVAFTLGSRSAIAVQDEDIDFDTTEDLYQVCSVEPGTQEHVAVLLGDDRERAPLYLYIGRKNGIGDGSFLDRNGLVDGRMFVCGARHRSER